MNYIDKLFGLEGKVALITGGGGVLAGAIGSGLAHAGAKIVLADINLEKAVANAESIIGKNCSAYGLYMDALDTISIKEGCEQILKEHGRIDILINAAGGNIPGATISPDKTIFDLNIKDFDRVSDLNYKSTLMPTLEVGRIMARQKSGSIINISSMAAMRTITRVVGYSAAKAAVSNFTRWMAMEMAMKHSGTIRVNAIAPGFFIGDQNRALLTNPDRTPTERGKLVIQNTPMGRFGEANELIGAVLFLASEAASFVTGVILPVDGGFSFHSGV
jgi:NAD(P)-dependent dehydrogenase (short-subunit alcohol dehydrogenase family)